MHTRHISGIQISIITTLAITVAGSELVSFAQRPSYPVGRRIEQINRQHDQHALEHMNDGDRKSGGTGDRRVNVMIQVQEDFSRLQSIYNEIVVAVSAGKKLDQAFISESVAGINKCATRLKTNLALPESKTRTEEKQNQKTGERAQPPLTMLLSHISEFVTNPMFESSGVLDIKLSIKASSDLDEIIHLSDRIRKSTEKPK